MASFKKKHVIALSLLSTVVLPGVFMAACSGDDNGGNPVPVVPTYVIEAGSPDSTVISDDSSTPGDDNSEPDAKADARVIIPEDAQACTLSRLPAPGSAPTDAGCWNCIPQTDPQFLNQCAGTGVTCVPFDNFARLPGYDGGALPSYN